MYRATGTGKNLQLFFQGAVLHLEPNATRQRADLVLKIECSELPVRERVPPD